jgi:hypothetical protein
MNVIIDSKPVSGNPTAKWCYACNRQLETTEFDKDCTRRDGVRSKCTWCRNQYMRNYMRTYRQKRRVNHG